MQKVLRKVKSILLPKIIEVKAVNPGKPKLPNADDDLINKAVSWWENNEYENVQRYKLIQWFGKTIIKIPFKETVEGNYFKPAHDLVEIIQNMQEDNILSTLNESSKILEPGCNVGRNLYYLSKKYKCEIVGIDISQKAIDIAKNKIWKNYPKCLFYKDNVLTTQFFDQFNDNHFDLVYTRWHLIHIPLSDVKKKYIESLKRISKTLILFEPVRDDRSKTELYHDGQYTLSWDNWCTEYNLKEYQCKKVIKWKDNTKVFYNNTI